MTWSLFIWFALPALLMWILGAVFAWKGRSRLTWIFTLTGIAVFFAFILGMWISLERPPLRTMGETRLWYAFFLPVAGIIVYSRWRYKWILSFSTLLAAVFILINLLKPEIHSKTLMPALQSPWFAPHVIVYMFAYALLGAATVMALYLLIFKRFPFKPRMTVEERPGMTGKERFPVKPEMMENEQPGMTVEEQPGMMENEQQGMTGTGTPEVNEGLPAGTSMQEARQIDTEKESYKYVRREMNITDNLVYVGLAFLTFGMLFGALWAKVAWGDYWSWDPKETWAAATWLCYLVYMHFRKARPRDWQMACTILLIAFVCLQMCWWGINYLPSAKGSSVHTY
jgi:cytochrome c-type biogenesis protein CcsB